MPNPARISEIFFAALAISVFSFFLFFFPLPSALFFFPLALCGSSVGKGYGVLE
jgi:hypothetical protein